ATPPSFRCATSEHPGKSSGPSPTAVPNVLPAGKRRRCKNEFPRKFRRHTTARDRRPKLSRLLRARILHREKSSTAWPPSRDLIRSPVYPCEWFCAALPLKLSHPHQL